MYKCPLCKKEYSSEREVIVCVNRCGRDKFSNGAFVKKEAPRREDRFSFNSEEINLTNKQIIREIASSSHELCEYLTKANNAAARKQVIKFVVDFLNEVNENERPYLLFKYNEISLMKQIYIKEK